jgi:hypothetical protein
MGFAMLGIAMKRPDKRVAAGIGELTFSADLTKSCLEVDVQIVHDDASLTAVNLCNSAVGSSPVRCKCRHTWR